MEKYSDILLYGGFFVTSIAFPIWASSFAAKRGRPGWSKIAFVSTLTGLGFFGGLLALFASSLKPGEVSSGDLEIINDSDFNNPAVVEEKTILARGMCPKCKSNMTQKVIILEDPVTSERIKAMNQERYTTTSGIVVILISAGIIIYSLTQFFIRDYMSTYLVAAGVGGYFAYLGLRPFLAKSQEEDKIILETFTCRRCKYKWDGEKIQ
jgi:hypothetical protein